MKFYLLIILFIYIYICLCVFYQLLFYISFFFKGFLKILLSYTFKEVIELTHQFGLELKDFII